MTVLEGRSGQHTQSARLGDLNGNGFGESSVGGGKPSRAHSAPLPDRPVRKKGIRNHVTFSERRFDVSTLPVDLQRVYAKLAKDFGEEYGLTFVFIVRTAVELHRAWHMTLLTSKILQQIKDKFQIRTTWNLGVTHLIFRVEDGGFELHRKVPYDYDSEFQDLYMKIAVALVEGRINIHEALIFQSETKQGIHTARSGLFFRANPGRLILYPIEAATCTVIFFGGDWMDAGVAAICGLFAGIMEWIISNMGGETKILVDVAVGLSTGFISGLFLRFQGDSYCVSSIFLGTLYWFFYGTAFVIGILEIVAGELATGVTRFIAVSVKTFVLALGSSLGFMVAVDGNVFDQWTSQYGRCNTINLDDQWWRIPLYLLCSASALGQYRFPIANYWRGLVVQLVGYEVQYQMFKYFDGRNNEDFLDTAASNILGAIAAVLTASLMSYVVDKVGYHYNARLLYRKERDDRSVIGDICYNIAASYVRLVNWLGLGRRSSLHFLKMEETLRKSAEELADPNHPRENITLTPEEEAILVEAIVEAENLNIWSLLMPAVYQLVPGSLIARLWYNAVFPPPLVEVSRTTLTPDGTEIIYIDSVSDSEADDVFYGLWVVSTSLALGLLMGFALVRILDDLMFFATSCLCKKTEDLSEEEQEKEEKEDARRRRMRFRQQGVLNLDVYDDPLDDEEEEDPLLAMNAAAEQTTIPLTLGKGTMEEMAESVDDAEGATTPAIVKLQIDKLKDQV